MEFWSKYLIISSVMPAFVCVIMNVLNFFSLVY